MNYCGVQEETFLLSQLINKTNYCTASAARQLGGCYSYKCLYLFGGYLKMQHHGNYVTTHLVNKQSSHLLEEVA